METSVFRDVRQNIKNGKKDMSVHPKCLLVTGRNEKSLSTWSVCFLFEDAASPLHVE